MKTRTALALFCSGLAVLGLALLLRSRLDGGAGTIEKAEPMNVGGTSDVGEIVSTDSQKEDQGALRSEVSDIRIDAPAESIPASESLAVLEGRVLERTTGQPVIGVSVQVTLLDYDGERESQPELTTDDEGFFRAQYSGNPVVQMLRVEPGPKTASSSRFERIALRAGEAKTVELRVGSGARIEGRVVDTEDRPIPGAKVHAWCKRPTRDPGPADRVTSADDLGGFALEHLGEQFFASASAPGFVSHRTLAGGVIDGLEGKDLTLVLSRPQALQGIVSDERGQPLSGVSVYLGQRWPQPGEATHVAGVNVGLPEGVVETTDEAGKFSSAQLAGGSLRVSVDEDGYLPWSEQVDPQSNEMLEVVLQRGAQLEGRVLSFDGTPALQAKVRLFGMRSKTVQTDGDGRFGITGFEGRFIDPESDGYPGQDQGQGLDAAKPSVQLVVSAEGCAVHAQRVELLDGKPNYLDVRLEQEAVLAGRVVDEDDQPVPSVKLEVEGERILPIAVSYGRPSTWEYLGGASGAKTDADGSFRFTQLYQGTFRLKAFSPTVQNEHVMTEVQAGSENLLIRLDPKAMRRVAFHGKVTDAVTGKPLQEFVVTPMVFPKGGHGSGRLHSFESPAGEFELSGFDPGDMDVSIRADGYAAWSTGRQAFELGEHQINASLYPECELTFSVVDEEGEFIEGVNVSFEDRDGHSLSIRVGANTTMPAVDSKSAPRTIHGLPAAPLLVRLGDPDYPGSGPLAEVVEELIDLSGPGPHVREFVARRGARAELVDAQPQVLVVLMSGPRNSKPQLVSMSGNETELPNLSGAEPFADESFSAEVRGKQGLLLGEKRGQRQSDGTWSGDSWAGPNALVLFERGGHSEDLTLQVNAANHALIEPISLPASGSGQFILVLPRN